MNEINQRIEDLREVMRREHLSAFVFPSTDPHQGEYVPDHWKGREFISGFNGSAGTAVVTLTSAALWTDSRYFIAAADQLKGTEYQLMKLKIEGTPTIAEWIGKECGPGAEIGIDGWCSSANAVKELIADLRQEGGITVRTNLDPLRQIWRNRPVIPEHPVEIFPLKYAGEPTHEKMARIREALRKRHADGMLMAALDDIAWTLNLRGTDVHCNPVFVSFLLINHQDVKLFIDEIKLTPEVKSYLNDCKVKVYPYMDFYSDLEQSTYTNKVLADPAYLNYAIYQDLSPLCELIEHKTYVALMKAIRNQTEIGNLHRAMIKDGVALVKFLKWLDTEADIYHETEMSVDRQLHAFRAAQADYIGESFDTIAGYGAHGAIVHYEATPETDAALEPKGFLLLDSGAQYLDGTTDITRTIPLGHLTQEEKEDYTLILKGHIDLAMAIFPERTRGAQLDILARQPIWRHRMNYLHGTGHGVGSFLNVHEGPHSIRMEDNPVTLQAGMVVTNEPGIYKAGSHGIRTENILLVVPAGEGMFGNYLQFETVTLCPIDKRPIIKELLSDEEVGWFNQYHQRVFDLLSPQLDYDERYWLANATSPL